MKVIDKRGNGIRQFRELNIGDIFFCNGYFYLKTKRVYNNGKFYNAIVLSDGECGAIAPFRDDERVALCTGNLVLE